jgi:FkbH-like protein
MSAGIYANLSWLPPVPADFKVQLRTLAEATQTTATGKQWRTLATHALNENQLHSVAKQFAAFQKAGGDASPLTPLKLGIISNATTGFIAPAIEASALRHGIALSVTQGNFNQPMQDALEARSVIHQAEPDLVLFALDYRALGFVASPGNREMAEESINAALGFIKSLRDGIKANSKAICIFQTLARPAEPDFGSYDAVLAGTERWLIEHFNRALANLVAESNDLLFDVASLAETVGLAAWHDAGLWHMAKQPFANAYIPLYADMLARVLAALRGKSRRALVLDLDNTVWGGIIGDDGIEGIVIGQGNPTGEAHLALQRHALSLRARGVVLAVSSKNTDEIARAPFQKHPEMALREEHIAVFQANWNDKATNIQAIAQELNLGLDAFVFLDDNPMERGLVRQMLPDVAVPELPTDPALYVATLRAAGYFEAVAFSDEDRKRADFYSQNARRVSLQKQAGDMESYLRSLAMVMTISPFNAVGRARISQLCNKSNQYNLTTHRYTEADIAAIETDPSCTHWQIRLEDIYGDNGMISVIICRDAGNRTWEIDTWLMSCRVLGRKVEDAALQHMLHTARAKGIERIVGVYVPTERNGLVVEHYDKLGFTLLEQKPDGAKRYVLEVATAHERNFPMTIVHSA